MESQLKLEFAEEESAWDAVATFVNELRHMGIVEDNRGRQQFTRPYNALLETLSYKKAEQRHNARFWDYLERYARRLTG